MLGTQCKRSRGSSSLLDLRITKPAGLDHWQFSFQVMGNIAASVGARLAVTQPCDVLSPAHNHNVALSCAKPWSTYFNFSFLDSGDVLVPQVETWLKSHQPGVYHKIIEGSDTGESLLRQYEHLRSMTRPFVWRLTHLHMLKLRDAFQGVAARWNVSVGYKYRHLCSYVLQTASREVVALAESFLAEQRLRRGEFVTLHLRRGDVLSTCDSSPSAVVAYVQCSYWAIPEVAAGHQVPLVVFSDETDRNYTRALLHALAPIGVTSTGSSTPSAAAYQRGFSRFVFAEVPLAKLAKRAGRGSDNFFVYAAVREVISAASAGLQMNRESCGLCGVNATAMFRPF